MGPVMSTEEPQPQLAPGIRALLGGLRGRIRRYVWLEGLAAALAVLCLAFWAALGIDWAFEPPVVFRRVLIGAAALAVGWAFHRFALRRAFVALADSSMALLLERRFDRFEDGLLTAVELTGREGDLPEHGREMLARTCHQALVRSERVDLGEIFNPAPLRRAASAALVLLGSVLAFALAFPGVFLFGIERLATTSDAPWPRKTRLVIEGFKDNRQVIARGSDLDILVKADTKLVVPQVVQVRYRTDEGRRVRTNLTREGNAVPGRDAFQDFKHTFESVLSSVRFDVLGGDARLRDLSIDVVDSPAISEMTLSCEYPPYMRRSPADVPVTGAVQLPLGTLVTVKARANKDLVRATIDSLSDQSTPATHTIEVVGARGFEFVLGRLNSDTTLSFTLLDTDGIQSREPLRLALGAAPDEPPQVKVRLEGIGSAITPEARLPLVGDVTDEYGVSEAWIEYVVDDKEPREQPFASRPGGRSEVPVKEAWEVRGLGLKPGQKLLVGTKAADNRSLPENGRPNVGQGERFLLDVVTPDELRALLESRELNLRQRFEAIIEEVSDTRDSLAALDLEGGLARDAAGGTPQPPAGGSEPEDEPADPEARSPERVRARRLLRVQRAIETSQKDAQETLGVATSFDGIRAELVNNRVDTEELRIRLKDHIADPLKVIAGKLFSEFDRRLERLETGVADAAAQELAVGQADLILVEMEKVRDKMLELESFNEAVELLREIIAAQRNLGEQTKKQRMDKVRELLEKEE